MDTSTKKLYIIFGILGATAVGLGAFGAHGLKSMLSPDRLQIYQTGIQYQFYHLVLFWALISSWEKYRYQTFRYAFWISLVGIICFSGSLYLLAIRDLLGITSWTWLGPITPIGGLLLIVGWSLLAYAFLAIKRPHQ